MSEVKSNIYVIHHKNCPDGVAAALAAYKFFGEFGAHYIPRTHTDRVPRFKPGAIIYFLDIALKRDDMIELAKTAESIVVLDHHKTAEAELVDLPDNVHVQFDMTKSGAQLAWAYFYPHIEEPKVVSHIADRDLWKFEIPNTREITEAVMAHEYDLSVYDSLITEPMLYARLLAQGEALLAGKENQLAILINEAQEATIQIGERVVSFPCINAPHFFASDLANMLLKRFPNAPFAGCYRDAGNGRRDWSLRSMDDRMDVAEIASSFTGGGGHRNAAGLSEDVPGQIIQRVFARYKDAVNA
jgi:uncharacterized protein